MGNGFVLHFGQSRGFSKLFRRLFSMAPIFSGYPSRKLGSLTVGKGGWYNYPLVMQHGNGISQLLTGQLWNTLW